MSATVWLGRDLRYLTVLIQSVGVTDCVHRERKYVALKVMMHGSPHASRERLAFDRLREGDTPLCVQACVDQFTLNRLNLMYECFVYEALQTHVGALAEASQLNGQ